MFDEMRLAGLSDPLYRQTAGSVRLTLSSIPADRALEDALPPQSRELLRHLRQVGRASTGELMGLVGASRPVVVRRLRALEEAGLVDWVGNSAKDPRAYWQLRRT
jgi:ATP-dependent DNA helicase RecG